MTIPAAVDRVLAVVLDVATYPEWQRDLHRVEVITTDGEGRPTRVTMSVRALGFRGHYTVDYSYPAPSVVEYHLVESDMMARHDARFEAVAAGDSTRLTVTMDLALAWPVPRPVVDRLAGRGVDTALAAIRDRAAR